MSGIVGLWNLEGPDVESELLEQLAATLAHRGGDGLGTWIAGPVGLACQLFRVTPESAIEKQPLVDHLGVSITFDGRLDNREELIPSLKGIRDISVDSPDPAIVLAAYDRFGDSFAGHLAGDFAFGLFDSRRQQLLLVRDALGVRPLYYWRDGQTLIFASEIRAILAHPKVVARPDDDAVADYFLGARDLFRRGWTFFDGVRAVRPGEVVQATRGELKYYKYWDFDPSKQIRLRSADEYGEAFRQHFETAVRRRIRSGYPVGVALSGGVDSSSIFCMAEWLRGRTPGLCPKVLGVAGVYEKGPADEKSFLLDIEREYQCEIAKLATGVEGFLDGAGDAICDAEAPYLNLLWRAWDRLLGVMQQQGARVLLTGDWGDQILFEQAYLVDLFRRGSWRRMLLHLREFPLWFTDAAEGAFRRNFVRSMVRYNLPEGLLRSLRRARNAVSLPADQAWFTDSLRARARKWAPFTGPPCDSAATVHAKSLYEDARMGFHYLMLERHNKAGTRRGLDTTFPFLDRDLVAFLMAIPGEMQTPDGVPKGLLRRSLRGLVPADILERRWKGNPTDPVNQAMEREFAAIVRYLDSKQEFGTIRYLNARVVREELDGLKSGIRSPNNLASWRIRDVLALELWMEGFFGVESHQDRVSRHLTGGI